MEQKKEDLLNEQIHKIEEVISVLSKTFADTSEDEISFLSIVKEKLKDLLK